MDEKQMLEESDMIFTQITSGHIETMEEANELICMIYVLDMSISRAGISHALKRLENHYSEQATGE